MLTNFVSVSNIGPHLLKKVQPTSFSHLTLILNGRFPQSFFFLPVCQDEIIAISKTFAAVRATCYDNVLLSIIRLTIDSIVEPFTHIINLFISQGIVPDEMKIARVIPLIKAGDHSLFANYRPVSVPSLFP